MRAVPRQLVFSNRRWLHSSPIRPSRLVLGIRAEDEARTWERRTPLTPAHVEALVRGNGVDVRVQPSAKRIYSDDGYARVRKVDIPLLTSTTDDLRVRLGRR